MLASAQATQSPPPVSLSTVGPRAWEPHSYQRTAVAWLVKHPAAALFLDPGLGKTSIALKAFCALHKAGGARKMLVVAPLRPAALVWSTAEGGELAKWADFADLRVSLIHGTQAKRVAACAREADIYVINYEGLPWLVESGAAATLTRSGFDVL
jgi:SNF2 family DNA or RNA helicase